MTDAMKLYIGSQVLKAEPMTREEYCELRGWSVPSNENPDDAGYTVVYGNGYRSWLLKDVFEDSYAPFDGMDFGLAIAALKQGMKVARAGWNGKGMWLALSPGADALPADKFWAGPNREFAEANGGSAEVLPCITMKTINAFGREAILMGWLASQTDMLASDWRIID